MALHAEPYCTNCGTNNRTSLMCPEPSRSAYSRPPKPVGDSNDDYRLQWRKCNSHTSRFKMSSWPLLKLNHNSPTDHLSTTSFFSSRCGFTSVACSSSDLGKSRTNDRVLPEHAPTTVPYPGATNHYHQNNAGFLFKRQLHLLQLEETEQ